MPLPNDLADCISIQRFNHLRIAGLVDFDEWSLNRELKRDKNKFFGTIALKVGFEICQYKAKAEIDSKFEKYEKKIWRLERKSVSLAKEFVYDLNKKLWTEFESEGLSPSASRKLKYILLLSMRIKFYLGFRNEKKPLPLS